MKVLTVNDRLYYVNEGLFDEMRQRKNYWLYIIPLGKCARERQGPYLKQKLHQLKPDYIFNPGWSVDIFDTEQFLRVIKSSSIPHVYWATEDPLFFHEVSMVFAPHSRYVFTTAQECVSKYRQLGAYSSTLMFACNPRIFKKVASKKEYNHDLVLVANNYHWFGKGKEFRKKAVNDMIKPLLAGRYDIKIWGADWNHPEYGIIQNKNQYGGYCPYLETPHVYSSAKIVLGLQSVTDSLTHTSTRTFEIMGTGAFYLTCYTPAHEHLFKNHVHLVWSKSPEETEELVAYYLKNDKQRLKIAAKGQQEVYRKHTYKHRLLQLEKNLRKTILKHSFLFIGGRFI